MKRQSDDGDYLNLRDPRCRGTGSSPPTSNKFFTSNMEHFNRNFPVFQLPKSVGFFSLDDKRNYHPDYSQLRYLSLTPEQSMILRGSRTCKAYFDLRRNITNAIEKDEESMQDKMLDDLLHWILEERKARNTNVVDITDQYMPLNTEFVCFRGLLTLLIATLYETKEGWKIVASRFGKTVYMFQIKNVDNTRRNPRIREMCLWGFKFEQYLCVDQPGAKPNADEQLNTNAEFCCILKTKLGGHSLLYGAEIDALTDGHSPPFDTLQHFVELKTTRIIENDRQYNSFQRFKGLKWWAQSFLVGIPTIICGYRDDNGIVHELEAFDVNHLRKDCDNHWKANICMNFLQQFLEFVNKSVPDDGVDHVFEYDPRSQTISVEKETNGYRSLLPDWYLDVMKKTMF